MTGLYLHIPFCHNKCFYCSFIVAISQKQHIKNYVKCLAKEMKLYKNYYFDSIYFGGGTPSQLSTEDFYFLMNEIKKNFSISKNAEVVVEMNPEDVTKEKLSCYVDCGVNRLSLGVQTFQDNFLKVLGRCHHAQQAKEAYHLIRTQGFDNVNIDLMYGFPNQHLSDIQKDLDVIGQLDCDHVSLYSLTIEKGSKFFVQGINLSTEEVMAEQFMFVRDALIDQGFKHYEISNFSKYEKESAHNLNYWQSGNYIGLGIGAHSHMDGRRWWNGEKVREYIQQIESNQSAEKDHEDLTLAQRLSESIVFGLRMIDGIDLKDLEERFGRLTGEQQQKIKQFVRDDFLEVDDGRLRVTSKGILVLDQLSVELSTI